MKLDAGKWQGSVITQPRPDSLQHHPAALIQPQYANTSSTGPKLIICPSAMSSFCRRSHQQCAALTPRGDALFYSPATFRALGKRKRKARKGGARKETVVPKLQISEMSKKQTKRKKGKGKNICYTNGSKTWELMFERNTTTLSMKGLQQGIGMLLWKSQAPFNIKHRSCI